MTVVSHNVGYVELEFEQMFVVGTYVPNSGENFKVRHSQTSRYLSITFNISQVHGYQAEMERGILKASNRSQLEETHHLGRRLQLHTDEKRLDMSIDFR
jgi:hypothetical protein